MSISATCPACNANYQVADTMRGKRVRCKSCSDVFVVSGKTPAPDYDDDDEERIQASPRRPARPVARDEEDEDGGRLAVRRRPLKKRGNTSNLPLLIVVCVFLGVLTLGACAFAVWAFTRSRQAEPPPMASNFNPPIRMPQPVQAPPPQNQGGFPAFQNPMPANGPVAVTLSNAAISGLGARMEVTVDYRFTSGNPAGRRLFLFIKATKAGGMLQSHYVAELHTIGNQAQGTIQAAGMTFGLENGPFELWVGEAPPGIIPQMMSDRDLKKVSNVVTVATKDLGIPGMPGIPGMGPPPGMGPLPGLPGRRPPFGPRGMRP